jgi:hypothetical protein
MLTLAILQKSTTVLPLIPVFGFWLLVKALPEIRAKGVRARVLWLGIGAYFIPFVIGAAWAKYTDFVKEYSAIGHRLTSGALFVWNFGTLQGRFSAHMWRDVIWQRDLVQNVGGVLGIVIFVVGLIRLRGVYRYSVAAAALLFLLYFFVFQNLHTVHEYYQMANLIFAVAAVSIALAGLMQDQNTAIRVGAVLAAVAMVVVNVHSFLTGFHYQEIRQSFDNDPVIQVSNVIRSSTDPGKPIIVFGDDWNSEIPFFSQRKGFVVPGFVRNHEDIVEHPEKYVGMRPSVIAICRDVRGSTFEQTVERVSKPTRIERTDVCDLLFM